MPYTQRENLCCIECSHHGCYSILTNLTKASPDFQPRRVRTLRDLSTMKPIVDVAIVGAGPYGLSMAAYLAARGVSFRIFGSPMHTWLTQMPRGMRLKSEGFASTLYDPESSFTLGEYCQQQGIPYADLGLPVPLETFAAYGQAFQKRLVPGLEDKLVVSVDRTSSGFLLRLEDGDVVAAQRVILAVGISHFQYVPPVLASLPTASVTHSSAHTTFEQFRGQEVTVIGAGASAADVAAALLEAGALPQMVARSPVIHFHDPPGPLPRPLLESIKSPMTGLGPGWRSLLCTEAPLLFHMMPEKFRLEVARRHLGPAPGWFVKDQLVGHIPFHLGCELRRAKIEDGRIHLQLANGDGAERTVVTDHVIAGTGYKVDLRRLTFLSPSVQAGIRSVENTPVLSSNFESSVPGLYFVGASSTNSFGPLARFAYGAGFTSRRLSRHLVRLIFGRTARGVSLAGIKTLQDQ
jgi:thioredoxin reductase